MQLLKQSTAVKVRIGPAVDATDGVTPETTLALSTADQAELLKHDGAATVDISAATWAAITGCDGWYDLSLTASYTDTLGLLEVVIQDESLCLPIFARFMVVSANVWDSWFGDDKQQVDVVQIRGMPQSAIDLRDFADICYDPVTNKIKGAEIVDTCTTNTDMRGTDNAALASVCTEGRLAELDAANIPADVDTLKAGVVLTAAGQQDIAQILKGTKGTVWFVATDGDDGNDGLSPDTAKLSPKTVIEAASANDVVALGPGTFDLGSSQVDVPNGVSVTGRGIDVTILTSSAASTTGAILVPGNHSLIQDLTIKGTGGTSITVGTNGSGGGDKAFVDALLCRVKGVATYDAFYASNSSKVTATLVDCQWFSGFDAMIIAPSGAASTFVIVRNQVVTDSSQTSSAGVYVGHANTTAWLYDVDIRSKCTSGPARGVWCYDGTVGVFGGRIRANASTANPLKQNSGTLVACGVEYDRSKTSGTITEVSGLDSPIASSPAAGSPMERIKTLDDAYTAIRAGYLDELAAANIPADVDAILADTNELQANQNNWLTATGFSTHDATAVKTVMEVDGSKLDHLWEMTEDDGGVRRYTTNSLEQAPTGGTNPNVLVDTTIASVTDQTHFTLTAGSDDDDAYKDQAVVVYDASENDYPSVRKCTTYTGATKTVTLDTAPDFTIVDGDGVKVFVTAPGTTAPTAAEVADAVHDEALAGHTGSGTTGEALNRLDDIQSQTDRLGTGDVTVTSPVDPATKHITLTEADDYDADETRSLEWTNANGDWGDGDITDAEVWLAFSHPRTGAMVLTAEGSVVTPTGTQKVRVELTTDQTALLPSMTGLCPYQLRLILANGRKETVCIGNAQIGRDRF